MKTLLHIQASPRLARSHSRKLSSFFLDEWLKRHPDTSVALRDLRTFPVPHVDEDWIAAAFTPPDERTAYMDNSLELSDLLVDESLSADIYLLGIPFYNFGMPSVVKAYVDNIVRINRTFLFTPEDTQAPYKSLVKHKLMFVVVSSGDTGYAESGELYASNHLEPHLRTAFGFIGIEDISFFYAGNDEFGGLKLEQSLRDARRRIVEFIEATTLEKAPKNVKPAAECA
ncbi:MAG: FMN-dependent NADH-azoreductase [Gammaproteobacteria bacterium]